MLSNLLQVIRLLNICEWWLLSGMNVVRKQQQWSRLLDCTFSQKSKLFEFHFIIAMSLSVHRQRLINIRSNLISQYIKVKISGSTKCSILFNRRTDYWFLEKRRAITVTKKVTYLPETEFVHELLEFVEIEGSRTINLKRIFSDKLNEIHTYFTNYSDIKLI